MIRKIKDFLGIEGVKIDLQLNETYRANELVIRGVVILSSQTDKYVEKIELRLVEKYRRGRGKDLLVNEYILAEKSIPVELNILASEVKNIDFDLEFEPMLSEMDEIERKNILGRPLVWVAKKLKNVSSEFRLEASARIKGTKLNPLVKKNILFK